MSTGVIVGTEECPTQKIANFIKSSKDFHLLHEKWPSVARDLEINEADVKKLKQNILLDKDQLPDVIHQVISIWVGKAGSGATLDKLNFALECNELTSIAESLKNEFQLQKPCWDVPSYYISRTIVMRNILDQKKFKETLKNSEDIFVFSGIKPSKLSRILQNQIVENSTRIIDQVGIRTNCIILDYPTHFDKICEKTNLAVHLIKADASNDKWSHVKSNGNLSSMRNLIDKNQTYLSEKELVELNKAHSICISESPGMGKSTLLQSIGQQLSTIHKNKTILFATMNEMVNNFENNEDKNEMETAIQSTLQDLLCSNSFQMHLFQSKLTSNKQQIELLLDGLDEVAASKMSLAFKILKHLSNIQSVRPWVTTRPHFLHELEDCLNVIGYNILEFTYENQVDFLKKFWISSEEPLSEMRLEHFAELCLNKLKSKMNRKDDDLAGIPLQCLLIGEVYQEQAKEHAVATDPNESWIVQINSVIELYEKLVEKQHSKYLRSNSNDNKLTIIEVNAQHTQIAFQLIFSELVEDLPPSFQEALRVNELVDVGLIVKSSSVLQPKFIHRTIAEFFIGKFLTDVICTESNSELSKYQNHFILKVVSPCRRYTGKETESLDVFLFNNYEICHFLDTFLAAKKPTSKFEFELNWKEIIQACVFENFLNLFEVFQLSFSNAIDNIFPIIFTKHFLLDAIRYSSLSFIKIIIETTPALFDDHETKSKSLKFSVMFGKLSIFLYLINVNYLRELISQPNEITKYLVHDCISNTKFESNFEVEQKLEMLKILLEINPDLLEQKLPVHFYNTTPLLCPDVHLELLSDLVSRNANMLAMDSSKGTVLHINPFLLLVYEYEDPLQKIIKSLVKQKNFNGETPLMTLLSYRGPFPEVLDKFKTFKADFNSENNEGYSILALSIKKRAELATIRKLIELGSNIRWKKGCKGKTLLHYAAEHGNVDAMVFLAKELKMNIFEKRRRLKSPFEYFVEWVKMKYRWNKLSNNELESIVSLAKEQMGYVPVEIKIEQLCQYVENMDDYAVKCLLKDQTQFMKDYANRYEMSDVIMEVFAKNFEPEPGSNILKYFISSGMITFAENAMLLSYNYDNKTTLLHGAVKHGNIELLRFLIEVCKHDVGTTSSGGNTPFHNFFYCF